MSESVQDINPADILSFKPTEAMARGARDKAHGHAADF